MMVILWALCFSSRVGVGYSGGGCYNGSGMVGAIAEQYKDDLC